MRAASLRSPRSQGYRGLHPELQRIPMNKGLLNVDEALQQLLAGARPVSETEMVPTLSATGRVLAAAQRSTMNVPPMDNSAMDGYAVRTADLQRPDTRLKVTQKIPAGSIGKPLAPGTAARIFTGAPIPAGADAIAMQEHCVAEGDVVVVKKMPRSGEWVRLTGSDIPTGGEVLPAGIRLRPQDTGLAASVGIASLRVFRKVRLGLFFTGDELVMPGDPLPPGRIYNSNRFTLNGLTGIFGCETRDYGIVPDSLAAPRGRGVRRDRHERRRLRWGCGFREARRRGGRRAPHVEDRHETGATARVRSGGRGKFHRAAGKSGFELRDLPHIRSAVPAQDAGRRRRTSPRDSRARRFRLARARSPARVPARKMECARRTRSLSYPGFRGAEVHGVGGRPRRQSCRAPHSRRGHGEVHAVFGAVSMKVKILYLASLREQLGKSGENLEISPATSTVAGLRTLLIARGGAWQTVLSQGGALRVAVNQEMAQ